MADTIKLSGTYDSIEAYNILTDIEALEVTIQGYKTDAETAATNAGTSETNAGTSATNAGTSESNASTYAGNALASANAAAGSANDALGSANAASASATLASQWASKTGGEVADGEYSAKYYAQAAASSASDAAASEAVVNGALPLSGGTMTGGIAYSGVNVIAKSDDTDEYVEIVGGTSESTGAHISVYGKDNTSKPGNITMEAYDGTNTNRMVLEPTGSAQIGGKEVERVNSSGTGYIRFESGLQICWNRVSSVTTSGKAETFLAAFKTGSTPRLAIATATNAIAVAFSGLSESGCTFKSASGSQAIDYIAIGVWK